MIKIWNVDDRARCKLEIGIFGPRISRLVTVLSPAIFGSRSFVLVCCAHNPKDKAIVHVSELEEAPVQVSVPAPF